METNKFKYLNYPGLDYDSVIYAIGKDMIQAIALKDYGYSLTDEELRQVSDVIDDVGICGHYIINAIYSALNFVIQPDKCNWKIVDLAVRDRMKESFLESKKEFRKSRQPNDGDGSKG